MIFRKYNVYAVFTCALQLRVADATDRNLIKILIYRFIKESRLIYENRDCIYKLKT